MTWSQPAVCSMLATSLAVMGARDRSFRSIREYGKHGITAVIRFADAVLHAEMRINSSYISPPAEKKKKKTWLEKLN
jgi:hypothetical protein